MKAARRSARFLWAAILAGLLAIPGCSGAVKTPAGPAVAVTVKDFAIHPQTPAFSGGDVTFHVTNLGPATHEFVIVRSDLPAARLPIGPDGLGVDEDSVDPVGEIGELGAGTTETLTLKLDPGQYDVFCNLEGHYLSGMHATLEVN